MPEIRVAARNARGAWSDWQTNTRWAVDLPPEGRATAVEATEQYIRDAITTDRAGVVATDAHSTYGLTVFGQAAQAAWPPEASLPPGLVVSDGTLVGWGLKDAAKDFSFAAVLPDKTVGDVQTWLENYHQAWPAGLTGAFPFDPADPPRWEYGLRAAHLCVERRNPDRLAHVCVELAIPETGTPTPVPDDVFIPG